MEGLMDQLTKTKQKLVEVAASHDQLVREFHSLEKINQQLLKEKKEAEKVAEDQKRCPGPIFQPLSWLFDLLIDGGKWLSMNAINEPMS